MKNFLAGVVLALGLASAAMADNTLVIGDYNNAPDSVAARLEAAGHTVTIQRNTANPPADISAYDQIWDLRWMTSLDAGTTTQYDDFVKNGGFLFMATENPGCCNAPNATKAALITQMGGGDTTIGGDAGSTENTVANGTNTTYMTSGLTVNFSAISAIVNDQGTALITDANGKVAAMMWVGNAGDLGTGYSGTVITIADINWLAQGFTNVDFVEDNTQALDDIINGVVAGTVAGTISDTGNGAGSSVGGGTSEPTLVSSTDGEPIVTETSADGGTLTTIVTTNNVSETTTEQTVVETTTTTVTTATDTTVCTTPTTVETYSDGSERTVNNTESCETTRSYSSASSSVDQTFTGRIDQSATAQDITNANIRSLEFNGLNGMAADHTYNNGMSGSTRGFTLGGEKDLENGLTIGAGLAQFNTSIKDADSNRAGASTTVLAGSIEKENVEVSVRHGMTDYTASRNIGPYSNAMSTSGTDTSVSIMFRPETSNQLQPVLGYTRGNRTLDGYTESGDALTARTVAESSEMYGYATIGGTLDFGLLDVTAIHHTDGVNNLSVGLEKESETLNWEVRLNRTITNLGDTNSVTAGVNWRF